MARPKDIEKHFKGEGVKAYWYRGNVFLLFSSGYFYLCPKVCANRVYGTEEEERLNKIADIIDVEYKKQETSYKLAEYKNLIKKYNENIQTIEEKIKDTEQCIQKLEKELEK